MSALPLQGVRVIDLGRMWAGPYATRMLGNMGAEVIKIEAVKRPDSRFGYAPENVRGPRPYNRSGFFNKDNVDKLGVTIDLDSPAGKAMFKRLVAIGDIVLENHTPRVMKTLGLDYPVLKEVKPDIIMISMPGLGMTGPRRDWMAWGTRLLCRASSDKRVRWRATS